MELIIIGISCAWGYIVIKHPSFIVHNLTTFIIIAITSLVLIDTIIDLNLNENALNLLMIAAGAFFSIMYYRIFIKHAHDGDK